MSLSSAPSSSSVTPVTTNSSSSSPTASSSIVPTSDIFRPPLFTPAQPLPSSNQNSQNTGVSIAASASLYLYTFLATLVLLLGVSAAIVTRSLILRRRHRRLVEEAIRNGTWVPPQPSPGPNGRARVDLSKKPKMWEAWLGGGTEKSDSPAEWESIKPFSVAYMGPTPPSITSPSSAFLSSQPILVPPVTSQSQVPPLSQISRRIIGYLRPTPPVTSPLPATTNSTPNLVPLATSTPADLLASFTGDITPKAQVAVLIAMPSSSESSQNSTSLASDDEERLPLIEVGIAEVMIVPSHPDLVPSLTGDHLPSGRKESMGSSFEVADVQGQQSQTS